MLKYFSLILLGYPLLAFASTDALDDKPVSQPSLSATSPGSSITSTDSFNKPATSAQSRYDYLIREMQEEEKALNVRSDAITKRENEFHARTGKWPWSDGRECILY